MNDEELRREYQRSASATLPGAHPEPEQLELLLNGDGPEAERLALLEHVLRCPTCGPELDLLRSASEGSRAAERRAPATRWLALAAAALLMIGIGTLTFRGRVTPAADVLRGKSASVSLIEPFAGASIARPVRLAWHRVDGATSYRVELLSKDGELISTWNTADTAFAIPDSARVAASESYDVWVRATLADRTEVSSPIVRFSVK
ncbi:MAG: hypothetical protein JWO39_281 [Gemmatimonadetes bacterium]|jgi:hypothetical protein|nr:hypothetical protein [Gemmatimonadota bacterium]